MIALPNRRRGVDDYFGDRSRRNDVIAGHIRALAARNGWPIVVLPALHRHEGYLVMTTTSPRHYRRVRSLTGAVREARAWGAA